MGNVKKKYSAEELLQFAYKYNQIPAVLFAKDKDCRYIYTSEIENLIDGGKDNSILGKTDIDIQYSVDEFKELRFKIIVKDFLNQEFELTTNEHINIEQC